MRARDRRHLAPELGREIADSLDLDAASAPERGSDRCWDYLVGHGPTGQIVALEPHPASTGEELRILEKARATRALLRAHLQRSARVAVWAWIPSGKVDFIAFDRVQLRLAQAGVRIVSRLVTAKKLGLSDALPAPKPSPKRRKGPRRR